MNNDIKEILECLEKYGQLTPDAIDDLHYIRDYITNLQTIEQQYSAILSENAELENKITNLQEENILLKEDKKDLREGWQQEVYDKDEILHNWYVAQGKIEKAIEYIKENKEHRKGLSVEEYHNKWCKMIDYYESLEIMNDLLNILEGDDKE